MEEQKLEIKNAVITKTRLGYQAQGIMTCYLDLSFGSAMQSFGGFALDVYDKKLGERLGAAYGMDFIQAILKTLEIERWENLEGEQIRVKADFHKIHSIGHFIKDQWFNPSELKRKCDE